MISIKPFLFILIAVFTCTSSISSYYRTEKKPNVIVIFVDDLGYGDLGCYGSPTKTPYIDQLALEGSKFNNFYVPVPVCSASRAALLTGCYPARIGIPGVLFHKDTIGINTKEYTLAEMFRDKNYKTACIGKWHLGWQKSFLPLQHGFDYFYGLPYSNDMWPRSDIDGSPVKPNSYKSNLPELSLIRQNTAVETITSIDDQGKLTSRYTEEALAFIKQNKKKPFFLYLAHSMPHIPLGVTSGFNNKNQTFYANVVNEIDWSVAQITKQLERLDLTDDTIIIFTSDNGPWLNYGNHAGSTGGLREGKGTCWEGGVKVPFIIRWPNKIPANYENSGLASTLDIMPSLNKIINGKQPDLPIDGIDLSESWLSKKVNSKREFIAYYNQKYKLEAVRKDHWKLILPHTYRSYNTIRGNNGNKGKRVPISIKTPELYNLKSDPFESINISDSHPEIVKLLMDFANKIRRQFGDELTKINGSMIRPAGIHSRINP